jgi:hypothetical protein
MFVMLDLGLGATTQRLRVDRSVVLIGQSGTFLRSSFAARRNRQGVILIGLPDTFLPQTHRSGRDTK